jgi:quercetin dioxygenase-like cupin family protein
LTRGGETAVYRRGDSYYIPAGVKHGARLFAGFKALDYFKDPDRYQVRK